MSLVLLGLFGLTLASVAIFHHHTLQVGLVGVAVIGTVAVATGEIHPIEHIVHELPTLANLFGLLVGFALLADHFEKSHVPGHLPRLLPDDWKGPFVLLWLVFVLSAFLDNIAAAMIGGTVAANVFQKKVHPGYLAAIVAASNGGGSGSVVGDTTTTMMWIHGVAPWDVIHAYAAAVPAVLVCGLFASFQQDRHQRIAKDETDTAPIDWSRMGVVGLILGSAISANVLSNLWWPWGSEHLPLLAIAVWAAILLAAPIRKPTWHLAGGAAKGAVFLLSLVLCASMMPVHELPAAAPTTAIGLGFVSAVFDNIPLTALALDQGGYDWGFLAFAVGYGGSMMWFGSSAGVAIANEYEEAKSTTEWLRNGWHVALGYVVGMAVMWAVLGWNPHAPHR